MKRGIVSGRVALLLRSTEIKPDAFLRSVCLFSPSYILDDGQFVNIYLGFSFRAFRLLIQFLISSSSSSSSSSSNYYLQALFLRHTGSIPE